jgi:tetratricopeptide (TPR) repeat protein
MNKVLYCIVFLLISATPSNASEDFITKFNEISSTNDDQKIQDFLAKAEDLETNNPEYYVLSANYWWSLSQKIVITTKPPEKDDFSLTDTKTGQIAGSISQVGTIDPNIPQKAVDILSKGVKAFPFRADIAIGLAHILRESGRYDDCIATLEKLLNTAGRKPNNMRWKNGESAFPDHPIAYNMLAALASANNQNTEALKHLLTAYKKDPSDPIIILNLGDTYSKLGQKKKAREYYNQVINSAFEDQYKEAASQKLMQTNE